MTGPAVNQEVQYDAYGNPIKAKAPDPAKPALTLATGNQTAGNTTAYANVIPQTPDGAGNLLGKTIQPGPAVDRVGLAQSAWDKSTQASVPAYEASLQSAKQAAAGVGQLGSGMLRTRLGDLAMQRQQQMDYERSKVMNDAITGSISDQYQNIGIAQQQQGFQASQQAQDFQQALAAQQAALSSQLGVGQLGVAEKQAETARIGTTGNLALGQGQLGLGQQQLSQQGSQFGQSIDLQRKEQELNRLVATGQLTIAQKDQQLRDLQNQQQYGLAGQNLTLAQQAQQNQQKQFNDQLELQRADLTQKYGAATADRIIEAQKVQNQQSQFQQAQSQQGQQFGQSLGLESQKLATQQNQFGQSLQEQIAQRLQSGNISQQEIAIKAQELQQQAQLQGRSLSIQEAQNQAGNMLAQQKIQQEGQQFGLSLAEQQAQRMQSGQQFQQGFGLDQQKLAQQGSQFDRSMSQEDKKMELDRQVQMGQLSVQQANQALQDFIQRGSLSLDQSKLAQQGSQFDSQLRLDQFKADLDKQVQLGQLTIQQAQQKLAEKSQAEGLSLDYAKMGQQDAQFGQTDYTTQRGQTLEAEARRQAMMAEIAKIFGVENLSKLPEGFIDSLMGGVAGGTSAGTPYGGGTGVPAGGAGAGSRGTGAGATPVPLASEPLVQNTQERTPYAPYNPWVTKTGTSANPFAGWVSPQGGSFGGAYAEKGADAPIWSAVGNRDPKAIFAAMDATDPALQAHGAREVAKFLTMNDTQDYGRQMLTQMTPAQLALVKQQFTSAEGPFAPGYAGYDPNRANQIGAYENAWKQYELALAGG